MGSFADRVRKVNAARTAVPPQQETAPSTVPSSNPPPSTQIAASPSAAATDREHTVISQSHVRKRYAIIEEVLTQQRSPPSAADLPVPQAAPPAEARLTQAELYQSFKARVRNTSTLAGGGAPTTSYYPAVETATAVGTQKVAGGAGSKKAGQKNKSPVQRKRKQNPSPAVMPNLNGGGIHEDEEEEEIGGRRVKVRKTADPAYLLDSEQDEEEDEDEEIVNNGGKSRQQRQQQQQGQQQRRNGARKQVKESGISASPPALRSFDAIFSTQVATEDKDEEEEEESSEEEGDLEERKSQQLPQTASNIPATAAAAAATAALLDDSPPEFRLRFDEDGNEILPRKNKKQNQQEQTEEPEEEEEAYLDLAVPGSIAKYLRPYQHAGIRFLLQNYARGRGALLADDMGLVSSKLMTYLKGCLYGVYSHCLPFLFYFL